MRNTVLDLTEFIEVLQKLKEEGVTDIMFLEHDGWPAMVDANNPEAVYVFKNVEDLEEYEDKIH